MSTWPLPQRIVVVQILAAAVGVTAAWFWDGAAAEAALLAAVSVIAPNAMLAWRITRAPGHARAVAVARRVLGQAVTKIVLTVVLMALAFVWFQPAPVPFFGMFVALQIAHAIGGAMAGPARRLT